MNHLLGLNEKQKQAVLKTEGPLLILAGAGAGKTKTITHRILHLVKSGVKPSEILAITFTNKAAKEMRDRIFDLIRRDTELNLPLSFDERPFVSTFHSLGVHIIRQNAQKLGLTRNFTIFDRNDSRRAVKDAIVETGLDPKQYEPNVILSLISREKGSGKNLSDFSENTDNDYMREIIMKVWTRYEASLKKEKALDFDDLLLKSAEQLEKDRDIRNHYKNVWQ